jgi:hypothetical protein
MGVKLGIILREEHRLKVFRHRVLRKIFGPKRDEVTGDWRKFHREHLPHSSPNTVQTIKARRMRWVGHVACTGKKRYS